jgi:hypothetical protein
MATPTKLAKLREPFPADQVKQRPGGGGQKLDYVAIETTLGRLLDVAPEFCWSASVQILEDRTAVVTGTLHIGDKFATGVGAMKNPDMDMAVKSANSEAIKNAAKNGWGVSLELWDADYRATLATKRALLSGSEAALKRAVHDLAKERLGVDRPSLQEMAMLFEFDPADLAEPEVLREILEREGVL